MKEALVLFMLALLILPLLLAVRTLRRLPPPRPSEGEDAVSPAGSPDEDQERAKHLNQGREGHS